jgi:25S rRNA (uracil2634-N3)-methyltransferase
MAKPGKKGLKAALVSQQSRLKKRKDAEHAQKIAEQKNKSSKGKAHPPRVIIPFSPTDKILLVGEGNFSFTRALTVDPPATSNVTASLEFLPPGNVTATAYDSEEDCYGKYADAREIVAGLRQKGVEVLFCVDATKLEKLSSLKGRQFDKIVWNFPHAGGC